MEPPRKRTKWSPIWAHFTENADRRSAKCNLCTPPTNIKISNGSTTGLRRHFNSIHTTKRPNDTEEHDTFDFEESICKMAAVDGFSFHSIAKSEEIRKMHARAGYRTPHSATTIRQLLLKCSHEKSQIIIESIKTTLEEGVKFSVCLDEWTSTANKRYMNVTIRATGELFYNLGLARVKGSATAEVCLDILKAKLRDFGISLEKDIVGIVTDGASVMKKMGRISGKSHQLCVAHGIHLAIVKTLYNFVPPEVIEPAAEQDTETDDSDDEEDLTFDLSPVDTDAELEISANAVVKKVRKVVKIFKDSTVRNDLLQTYVRNSNGGKELSLILDVKTRWNSLVNMLERFLKLINEIEVTLEDLHQPLTFQPDELDVLHKLVAVLKPVKVAAESICSRDSNLRKCDLAVKFMMEKLSNVDSDLSRELQKELKEKIYQRRTALSDVMHYLHTGERPARATRGNSKMPKTEIINLIRKLTEITRPQESETLSSIDPASYVDHSEEQNPVERTLESELHILLQEDDTSEKNKTRPSDSSFDTLIKNEMALHENGGSRGAVLESAYKMISSIPPTSVESERVFSTANNFCTKLRANLKDDTLHSLVLLKFFYLNFKK